MSPLLYDGVDHPVTLGPDRADLRYSSLPIGAYGSTGGSVALIGDKTVSFANVFATQPWVAAAVMRLMTWAVRVPLKCYRRTGTDSRVRLRPNDHPLARAVVEPWETGSQADLIMAMLGPLLIHGNDLTEIQQGRSDKLRFDPIDWRFARPIQPWPSVVSGWDVIEIGNARTVGADNVMHLAWWSPLGPLGISPLQQLGTSLAIEDAAQRYQKGIFNNAARIPSVITASEEFLALDPIERKQLLDNLREDVNNLYVGPENAGRSALFPPGLDLKPAGHSAVEAELINQRKVAREEVCAVYQIPPPMLGILDRATFSNIEIQREMAYTDSLAPPLVLIEQKLNAHLVRGLLHEDDIYLEFDFAAVLRGDKLKEINAYRLAVGNAMMTPNEIRSGLNLPRSEEDGMDAFWMPTNNMQRVGSTDGGGDTEGVDGTAVPA